MLLLTTFVFMLALFSSIKIITMLTEAMIKGNYIDLTAPTWITVLLWSLLYYLT